MNKEVAQAAMQFMLRVSLQGSEVPAFNIVMAALEKVVNQPEDTECQTVPKT